MNDYVIVRNIKTKKTKAIRIGWSWPAFLISVIWALSCGLIFVVIYTMAVIVTLSYILNILTGVPQVFFMVICALPVPFIYGSFGNKWQLKRLTSARDYFDFNIFQTIEVIRASNSEAAVLLYLQNDESDAKFNSIKSKYSEIYGDALLEKLINSEEIFIDELYLLKKIDQTNSVRKIRSSYLDW